MKISRISILIVGLALGTSWAVRGQFGHEQGAAWAGAIGAMCLVLVSKRQDWYRKILTIALASSAGWGAGGMISYGLVVGYGRSDNFPNAFYGLLMLFVIGGLFGLLGGGLTGLALESSKEKKVNWGVLIAEMTAGGIIIYYLLIYQLEILMTPPRSEAWAVCLGAGIAMLWHMAANQYRSSLRVAIITAAGAGFGFAFGNFLQITGNVLQIDFNMWNVMEYSIGFFGGTSLAYAIFSTVWPAGSYPPEQWENVSAYVLLFIFVPFVIFSQSFDTAGLAEKFSRSSTPGQVALFTNISAAVLFALLALLSWFKRNPQSRNDAMHLFLTSFAVYIAASYIVSGVFAGIFLLNHHLYAVNYILIFLLIKKQYPAFHENAAGILNGKVILKLLAASVIVILLLALLSVSIHGELPGAHDRF